MDKPSLYARYYAEREGRETIEKSWGFANFILQEDSVYLVDIYVDPDVRSQGYAKLLANEIMDVAREHHLTWFVGSVDINAHGAADSMKVLLAYDMEPYMVNRDNGLIMFRKPVGG